MKKIIVTAEIWKEGNMFTAYCPEYSSDEAKKNLSEVIGIQLEETSKLGTLKDFLAEAGYFVENDVLHTVKKIVGFEELSIPVGIIQ